MNSSFLSLFFVLALVSFVFAVDPTGSVTFQASYVLTDNSLYPNGEIPGTVYYTYNTAAPQQSKVRYEHILYVGTQPTTIVELDDFNVMRSFKICGDTCESYPLARTPTRWWYTEGDAEQQGDAIGDFKHYTRSVTDYGVTDLWLKHTNLPGNTFYLKKLIFSTGRTLIFNDEGSYSTSVPDDKFDPNAGDVVCSTESCRTYMDLVFVLDSSASVKQKNWNTMVKFVKNFVNQTDISAQSGAVAVVGFGGDTCNKYESQCKGDWMSELRDIKELNKWYKKREFPKYTDLRGAFNATKDGKFVMRCGYTRTGGGWGSSYTYTFYPAASRQICDDAYNKKNGYNKQDLFGTYYLVEDTVVTFSDSYNRCGKDFQDCNRDPVPFLSKTYVDLSYGQKDDILTAIQNEVKYEEGDTCQALGLQRAMAIFDRNERAAANGGLTPQRVVIVLTDGDDHCANMTKTYADILKTQYHATVIEVSITLKYLYDKQLLENISSRFGGNPAYFDVDDFEGLQEHIDKMVTTVCQTDYSDAPGKCDTKCYGFCGCGGQCFCPTCSASLNSVCHSYACEVVDDKTAGCVDTPTNCDDGLLCTEDTCVEAQGGCVHTGKVCGTGLKDCQTSTCSEDLQGQCEEPTNDPSLCPPYRYPCYEAICDPDSPDSDSVSGCRYEYSCGGPLPVVYDENNKYVSGCYEYTCDNNTGKCGSTNVCDQMSTTNKCFDFTCDTTAGKCVESNQKVVCPELNGCRTQSVCNNATGQCNVIEITANGCKNIMKQYAKDHHTGDSATDKWFNTDEDVETYYNCGEHVCDPNVVVGPTTINLDQNDYCVFTRGDNDTCSACASGLSGQATFEICEAQAIENHANNPSKCYTSVCKATSPTESICNETVKECPHKPCMEVVCNQDTFQCEYQWIQDYIDLEKNVTACNKLVCSEGDKPELIDISESKCVGDNNEHVPVCQLYDRCDAKAGCMYRDKCTRVHNCTTMTCNRDTNECEEEPVVCKDSENICYTYNCSETLDKCVVVLKPLEESCGVPDMCHEYTCSVIQNKCLLEQIPYPNETDLCHNYTCHPETGEWTVVEKCDDGNICTVDSCTSFDGSCTNFKRDCHELNMTGYGSCFGRSCSKSRKNGCFRKVYENSYFDECGNCIRSYSADDSGVTDSEVSDCKKDLSFQEEAAVISAGVLAAIIAACVIGAIAVSTAGTLATKELIKRARAANNSGSVDNPLFEEDGQEMENPTFVGND